ncbi:MAG TPA: MurR/RpiR family transcriptional regulator [Thermodesulfobacteriota bacterium]|nr:MurR/RpiR family transcriptional regulator [Thermodesulfobacteriota bacterium]
MEHLLRKLKAHGNSLPQSQRKLLEYFLAHEEESVFLKIADLARRAKVSQATVSRLSQTLGFRGFPGFQKELQRLFRNKLTTTSRLQNVVKKVNAGNDVLTKVLQADMENISQTLKQTSLAEFRKFVECLATAERVVIVGLRSAHSLALFLGVALEFLQRNVWVLQPGIGDMWDRLLGMKKGDVVLGISFPRYTQQTIEVLRFAQDRGLKTLAITDTLISPLAQYAHHVLTACCKMDSFIESFTAPLSLINALATALAVRDQKTTLASLQEMETIWKTQKIYYHREKKPDLKGIKGGRERSRIKNPKEDERRRVT